MKPRTQVITAGLLIATGCREGAPSRTTDGVSGRVADRAAALATLRTADSLLQVAVTAKDAERTAAFYADSAVMMPVAEPIVEGRAAIVEEWRHVFGIPGYASLVRLTQAELSDDGTLGYTRGTYESPMLAPGGVRVVEKGKWVSVWRRQADGQWRIVVDVYNTDSPPPDHQPSAADAHKH